jgi:hypothetical protein
MDKPQNKPLKFQGAGRGAGARKVRSPADGFPSSAFICLVFLVDGFHPCLFYTQGGTTDASL